MSYLFVTGAHRSGTSLTAQVLHACGAAFGSGLARGNKHNPHGYMENLNMRIVLKDWLERIGADRLGQWPFPPEDWTPTEVEVAEFRHHVSRTLGYTGGAAHKDPKMLPLWPLAHRAFPDARWVVVRRDPDQIARSCMKAPFMSRCDTFPAWRKWAVEMGRRCEHLRDATDAVEVWPDPEDPDSFRGAVEFCGLAWNRTAVEAVCHPEDWRRAS